MKVWQEIVLPNLRRSGVILNRYETDDMFPMNPEGTEVDVHQGRYLPIDADIR